MIRRLQDLSIAKKLYAVMAIMALFMVVEFFTLRYALATLSTMRVFVELSGHWALAQKSASLDLYQYAATSDEKYIRSFYERLRLPQSLRQARYAMHSCEDLDACPEELQRAIDGFAEAGMPREDLPRLLRVTRSLRGFGSFDGAVALWERGDRLFDQFQEVAEVIHQEVRQGRAQSETVRGGLREVNRLNDEFTVLIEGFSSRTVKSSKLMEWVLMGFMAVALISLGFVACYIIYRFIRYFSRSVEEVKDVAGKVGQGDFTQRIGVHSQDELGQMAERLNRMIGDLQVSVGRQVQAESANQVKSLFLANMSHEVRTPLGVILGLTEILKDPSITSEDRQKYIGVIEKTGHSLQQIINDILDISKVEAGHLDIQKAEFELEDFISELNLNLQLLAQRGKNRLEFQGMGRLPRRILSDRTRVRQILTNLIGNGLKFTQEGTVTVSYGMSGGFLNFRVKDTGIGIPEKERSRLFKPFSQVDHGSNRKYGGTGLGLLLSKRLAQSLGGDIRLESSMPGVGSVFTLILPVPTETASARGPKKLSQESGEDFSVLQGKHVLLVEDSPDNQMLVKLFLSRKQMLVDFANNGKEGIEKALNGHYDLVLMDMQMPVVDGYTATEELRQKGYRKPIVALTAHAMKEDRERCLKVGCNDYLTKPIDPPLFYRILRSHVSQAGTDLPLADALP